jgi:hypothetical protein
MKKKKNGNKSVTITKPKLYRLTPKCPRLPQDQFIYIQYVSSRSEWINIRVVRVKLELKW